MVINMNQLEMQRQNLDSKIDTLSNLEKCEFDNRVNKVINSKAIKYKLIKQHRNLQEGYQNTLKNRRKNEIKFLVFFIITFLIVYFFTQTIDSYVGIIGVIISALIFSVYEIKKDIFDSQYLILYRNFEFEIDRYLNEINQYGHLLTSESDLFYEYIGDNENFKNKFIEKTTQARIELEIEILKTMNVKVESKDGN